MLVAVRRQPAPEDEARHRLRRIQEDVERRIGEAAERGEFAHLPGEGSPLPRDQDEGLGDRWAAAHVVRNAEITPEWVELRREIQETRERLVRRVRGHRDWLAARSRSLRTLPAERILDAVRATDELDRRFQDELGVALAELNAKVARYNLHVRARLLQLAPLTAARLAELAREPA